MTPASGALRPPEGGRAALTGIGCCAAEEQAEVLSDDAFVALYQAYRKPLIALCLARAHDRELAEDLAHDVFLKAYAERTRFDQSRPFWPWLASIAIRHCIDEHRRRAYAESRTDDILRQVAHGATTADCEDFTLNHTLARLEHDVVQRAVSALPARQRLALQLFALEGWTYQDIASHFGASAATVKQLIARARARLREERTKLLGGFAGAWRGFRARWHEESVRVHAAWSALSGAAGGWTSSFGRCCAAIVAAVALADLFVAVPADDAAAHAVAAPVVAPVPHDAPEPQGAPPSGSGRGADAFVPAPQPQPPPRLPQATAERAVNEVLAPALEALSPPVEGSGGSTMAVSPNYEDDKTVFISHAPAGNGAAPGLHVTHDGGRSWARRRALGFVGADRLLLPPAYPSDPRIFAMGMKGLQVSHDDGETFETLAVLPAWRGHTDAAFSPSFNSGDPTALLVVHGRLYRYRDDAATVEPVALTGEHASDEVDSVRFKTHEGTGDPVPTVVLVTRRAVRTTGSTNWTGRELNTSFVNRCTFSTESPLGSATAAATPLPPMLACEGREMPHVSSMLVRLALSKTGTAATLFLNAPGQPYASSDDGRTLRRIALPDCAPFCPNVTDFDVSTTPDGTLTVAAVSAGRRGAPQLYVSRDQGETWAPAFVGLPGFRWGAWAVAVVERDRIIATGTHGDIACSVDAGRTWAPQCPAAHHG